jgi:hypothetical protein
MNPTKIIFLDLDGVINTISRSYDKDTRDESRVNSIAASKQLNRILKETNCKVVVSSSWRTVPDYMNGNLPYALERMFGLTDFVSHYIGDTPDLNPVLPCPYEEYVEKYIERGVEIKSWLDNNQYDGKFVILDDIADEFEGFEENLFVTKMETGITKEIADAVIKYLNT